MKVRLPDASAKKEAAMNTQRQTKTPEFQPNIPLLDREFDTKSSEIEDFILFHAQIQSEDISVMGFYTQTR